jgi:hypothetical protein
VRDLTKSMMSCGWAMGVFGVQQMLNVMMPAKNGDPCGKAAKAFNDVTKATVETLDGSLKSAFDAGNNLQGGLVDTMFGGMMSAGLDPGRWMRMGGETLQRMADLGKSAVQTATASAGSQGPGAGAAPASPAASSGGGSWGPMPR